MPAHKKYFTEEERLAVQRARMREYMRRKTKDPAYRAKQAAAVKARRAAETPEQKETRLAAIRANRKPLTAAQKKAQSLRFVKWKLAHPERAIELGRKTANAWSRRHPEKVLELSRRRYRTSPKRRAQVRAQVARWEAANPERVRMLAVIKSQRRRMRLRGTVTADEWVSVLDTFGHRCAYCGIASGRMTMDHVVAVARGGAHSAHNVVPACQACNCKKHVRGPLSMVNVAYRQEKV